MKRTLIILGKELRELLREPHVLVLSLGFPLIFYPLMIWGGLQFQLLQDGLAERHPPVVAFQIDAPLSEESLDALKAEPLVIKEGAAEDVSGEEINAHLALGQEGEGLVATLTHMSTDPTSERARDILKERLDELRLTQRGAIALNRGLEPEALAPFEIKEDNLAPPKEMGSYILSRALPGMMVIVMLLAGLYPAVEVVVGERERSTLETTLSSAASRGSIILGKVLAILTMMFIAVVGNLGAMGLTLFHLISLQKGESELGINISGGDMAIAIPTLLMGGVFVAALMVISVLPARSFKEGQNLASFTMTAGMTLIVIAMLPGVDLTAVTALVPLTNIALVLRDGLNGQLSTGLGLLVLGETTALSLGLMAVSYSIVNKESYLFAGALPSWLKWLERFNDRG